MNDPVVAERMQSVERGYIIEAQGLVFTRDLASREEWEDIGRAIVSRAEGAAWALGDWLIEGGRAERRWYHDGSYDRAMAVTGYSKSYLCSAYQTSLAFPRDARRPTLSWAVHRSARRLPVPLRNDALREAAEHRWTDVEMNQHIDQINAKSGAAVAPHSRSKRQASYYQSPMVRCPHCQHEFPIKGNKVMQLPPPSPPDATGRLGT